MKYLLPTLGLALLWGIALAGQAQAGECCATAGCEASCGNGGCEAGCDCCPRCGCKLVPSCQMGCDIKKTTEHKYCCTCKPICIPGVTRLGERCESCNESGACGACGACQTCNNGCDNGCGDCCDCRCRVHEVHKLMVCPESKEHSVRKCTVVYVCPNCSGCGGCGTTAAPAVAPAAPGPGAPAPAPAPNANRLPPPPKTTSIAVPESFRTAQAGF